MSWTYLVVGAVLTLVATLFAQAVLQLYVVPRVETRKRREDRWERDVLKLGDVLTAELPERAAAARADVLFYRDVRAQSQEAGPNSDRYLKHLEAALHKCRETAQGYRELGITLVGWLAERIISLGPSPPIREFARYVNHFRLAAMRVILDAELDGSSDDDLYEAWTEEAKSRDRLTAEVKRLAKSPRPPRLRLRDRIRAKTRRSWAS